jgi:hypothetical protein
MEKTREQAAYRAKYMELIYGSYDHRIKAVLKILTSASSGVKETSASIKDNATQTTGGAKWVEDAAEYSIAGRTSKPLSPPQKNSPLLGGRFRASSMKALLLPGRQSKKQRRPMRA